MKKDVTIYDPFSGRSNYVVVADGHEDFISIHVKDEFSAKVDLDLDSAKELQAALSNAIERMKMAVKNG